MVGLPIAAARPAKKYTQTGGGEPPRILNEYFRFTPQWNLSS
jgi:hypothetical protein